MRQLEVGCLPCAAIQCAHCLVTTQAPTGCQPSAAGPHLEAGHGKEEVGVVLGVDADERVVPVKGGQRARQPVLHVPEDGLGRAGRERTGRRRFGHARAQARGCKLAAHTLQGSDTESCACCKAMQAPSQPAPQHPSRHLHSSPCAHPPQVHIVLHEAHARVTRPAPVRHTGGIRASLSNQGGMASRSGGVRAASCGCCGCMLMQHPSHPSVSHAAPGRLPARILRSSHHIQKRLTSCCCSPRCFRCWGRGAR